MKVLLVALNSKYTHINIALYYLKNKIKDICNVSLVNLNINENLDSLISKIIEFKPNIISFGTYIWNIEQILKISESIKKIDNNIIISLGGPEVSYNPEEILRNYPFIDCVQCLESENNIIALINDAKNKSIKPIYSILVNSNDIPSIADDLIDNYDGRAIYFETSRGCPFRCSYCLSCIDKTIKYFNLEKVKEDLKKLLDKDVVQIRFIDRTFNSDRKRAITLWKFLIENRKNTTFHFEICAALIDEETLNFLKTVPKDIFRLEIGIQSTNKKTLEAINRKYNFDYEKEIIKKLVSFNNLHIHTDLIIGLPYETKELFKKSFNDLYSLHTTEMQLGFLKFLKGTDIYFDKDKFEYIYNNFPPYEVLSNNTLSYDDICYLKKFEITFELLHNSKMFINSIKYLETKYINYFNLYETITNYFITNKLIDRKISYEEIYTSLIDLYNNDPILIQTLTYDYASNFKGTREWMFNKYDLKKEIKELSINNTYFKNMSLNDILKKYRFIVLDYNIKTFEIEKNIYYFNK